MTKSELRLELLKLTFSHGLSKEEVVGRTTFYEDFVFQKFEEPKLVSAEESEPEAQKGNKNSEAKSPDKRLKSKSGNVDSLI